MRAITPILTLFYPGGEGSFVNTSDASLSCVKVIELDRAALATMVSDNGAISPSALSHGITAFAMLLTTSLVLLGL